MRIVDAHFVNLLRERLSCLSLLKVCWKRGKWGAYLLTLTLEESTGIMTVFQWFLSLRVMSCVEHMLPSQVPHQVWCSAQVLHISVLVSCLRCWTFSLKSPLIGESWIEFTVVTRVSHARPWCTDCMLCFLSQGWFKGAFVSLDLPKQHTDSSGHVICVK